MATLPSTIRLEEKASFRCRMPEQLALFDVGLNLSAIREARDEMMQYSQAANTTKAYRFGWKGFAAWCRDTNKQALPASPDTVSLFIAWAGVTRKPKPFKFTHVKTIMAAIKDRHRAGGFPLPIDETVRATMAAVPRRVEQESGGKDALTPEQLRRAVLGLPDNAVGVRDRAILLVGFTTGWRSSELVGLRLNEVHIFSDHVLFRLRKSKTDQEGKGREVRIPRVPDSELCPVAALEAWIKLRGARPGALFLPFWAGWHLQLRDGILGARVICGVVKKALKRAGIKRGNWGGHSLRAGMITAAAENGADVISIQERTGHKRLETIAKYVRAAGGFKRDPLAGIL